MKASFQAPNGAIVEFRDYVESDAPEVGRLIAATYVEFNLSFVDPQDLPQFLGPFRHASSTDPPHQAAIVQVLASPIFLLAEANGEILGVLRGRRERLASLFVRKDVHRQGIGRRLVERFERESVRQGVSVIRLAATLYAVPFYLELGYRRSTGVRSGFSFDGRGFLYQPMRKRL